MFVQLSHVFFVFTVVVAALINIKKCQDLFQNSTETILHRDDTVFYCILLLAIKKGVYSVAALINFLKFNQTQM